MRRIQGGSASRQKSMNALNDASNHRAKIQVEGLRRARAEMFKAVATAISTGRCDPDGATIALIEEIVERACRIGIETQSDALQPEFAEMSTRIAELEEHLSGAYRPIVDVHCHN